MGAISNAPVDSSKGNGRRLLIGCQRFNLNRLIGSLSPGRLGQGCTRLQPTPVQLAKVKQWNRWQRSATAGARPLPDSNPTTGDQSPVR